MPKLFPLTAYVTKSFIMEDDTLFRVGQQIGIIDMVELEVIQTIAMKRGGEIQLWGGTP